MAEHKDCKHYDGCDYRNDIGCCPNWCAQFKHKDDVRVVRCKDCKHCTVTSDGMVCECALPTKRMMDYYIYGSTILARVGADDFCSHGERRTDD